MHERPPAIVILVYGLFLFLVLGFIFFLGLGFLTLIDVLAHTGTNLPDITAPHI